MREKFFDIRKRAFTFPTLGGSPGSSCIPTTSGTGAEITPFAVITDPTTGKKYPLADYALTPSVAIIDPVLTADLPPSVAADSGFDALTHATEAYVSVYANDYTDGLALHAIRLIFENLERAGATTGGDRPAMAREKMHNAGSIAGHGLRQRVPRHRARHGAHPRRHVPHRARPHQRDPAAARHPLQRHGAGEAHRAGPSTSATWPRSGSRRSPARSACPPPTPEEGVESLRRGRGAAARRGRHRAVVPGRSASTSGRSSTRCRSRR